MAERTKEVVLAEIEAVDADVVALTEDLKQLDIDIVNLRSQLKEAERKREEISGTWGRGGTLPRAKSKAESLRDELRKMQRPCLVYQSKYGGDPERCYVDSLGPKQMRTSAATFTRCADGSWESWNGTIAPFDEVAVKALLKAISAETPHAL